MDLLQKIPLDPNKRHFVVGDVHGRYEPFLNLLEEINYDETTDMIYSVGDLIDRGPQSVEVVEFFMQSNCWAVRGNHEQMVVNPKDWLAVWMYEQNGGPATIRSLQQHDKPIEWLQAFCNKLPLCLDVGEDDQEGAFRLIHAELPPSESEDTFRNYLLEHPEDAFEGELLWGRRTVQQAQRNVIHLLPASTNIDFHPEYTTRTVICGHTPTERPIRCGNMWWIDTWKGGTMTMINAITLEKHSVKAR